MHPCVKIVKIETRSPPNTPRTYPHQTTAVQCSSSGCMLLLTTSVKCRRMCVCVDETKRIEERKETPPQPSQQTRPGKDLANRCGRRA